MSDDTGRERLYTIHGLSESQTLDVIEADAAAMRSLERLETKYNERMRMFLVVICLMGIVGWLNIISWGVIIGLKLYP